MTLADVAYAPELTSHDAEIEEINAEAFGPGRFTRAAHRIREGGPHARDLSFVATENGHVIASVRLTPIAVGEGKAMLLGPLAVRPSWKNLGIGRKLMGMAADAARARDVRAIVLVGDAPYYGPLGYVQVRPGTMTMPWPVDPARLLVMELVPGAAAALNGMVVHEDAARA
ncbi:N-acetyltransferase [Mesorhizobium sp. YIM 152430]|uniref:GNAT family N-acetyltransferase n=1 Tax=Mesorhizobium sp. YIM 152430 TaxID=3031761 RepID=UPI0023DC0F22|nr:N-acetyltransferase [Mesorhizobium sp. YIM 152430]MDF1598610.1 N-acetyltransferase [Mesorhizobium sp. YIM 152430]